jgi:hypothetical protein
VRHPLRGAHKPWTIAVILHILLMAFVAIVAFTIDVRQILE